MLPNIFVVFPAGENHGYRYSSISSMFTCNETHYVNRAANVPENSGGSGGRRTVSRWLYEYWDRQQR
jgi:hypothetical protein